MRYLVTGGAGFIGSHLVDHLAGAGAEVVVLDDFSTGHRENLSQWRGRIELIEGSITDPAICARAMRGVDFVLHQAALPSVPRSIADPMASHTVNATGTLTLLLAARDAGVRRLVYAGSSSAYGDTPELPKRESMPARPLSPYAIAKLVGEHYCGVFYRTYGLETVTLRYFNVFGPRQDSSSAYAAVIPKFIEAARKDASPVIFGDGAQTRDFTFVANVVRANLLACEAPAAPGRVFNIGCGHRMSISELWERIRALVGTRVDATHAPARPGDVRDSLASLDQAEQGLAYGPDVTLEEGLRRTVETFATGRRDRAAVPGGR